MPRKAFIADVAAAAEKSIPRISGVARGGDDGDVNFRYSPVSGAPIELSVLAIDVAGYPAENNFMVYSRSSDLPRGVESALEELATCSAGSVISELLTNISERLQKVLATGSQGDPFSIDDGSDTNMADGEILDESEEEEDYYDDYSDFEDGPRTKTTTSTYRISPESAANLNRRIKEDLRIVRFAGFKLGILSGLRGDSRTSVVSISIQASKLGLSEEALQAWDLEPKQYIILLIRYSDGYRPFETIISEPAKSHDIAFRIGVSNKYKPTIHEALAAFAEITKNANKTANDEKLEGAEEGNENRAGFSTMFISSSLNEFINNQFISLLKIRHNMGIGWDGAKRFFNDKQGLLGDKKVELPSVYFDEPKPAQSSLPDVVAADHMTENNAAKFSFPLVAAQFSMRYLVRCTEFCLVCHDRIEEGFEALKPYVCSKPLCLYQYMSLGFGPSVEHEILTQPYVVDLLASFCYSAATGRRLREYPTGMSLLVPPVPYSEPISITAGYYAAPIVTAPATFATTNRVFAIDVRYDVGRQEIVFLEGHGVCPLQRGEWVVLKFGDHPPVHHRVEDTSLYPTVKLSDEGITRKSPAATTYSVVPLVPATPATTPPPPLLIPATMAKYDQNFDDMDEVGKAESIVMLLETLPTIKELRSYLVHQRRSSEPSLRAWKERVSPAALGILRWIIASNRSCIVQVDVCPGQTEEEVAKAKIRLDQKCSNVHDHYVQFRFAQGAPDKEQRFLGALKAEQANLDPKFPTIFAWHGSPLQNWHSIIRHGLDFKETLHGRSYGHGVYHAKDQSTSVGYAQSGANNWPGSSLAILSAMSLNEIVNCPGKYTSSTPFLVVQHIDWIQCRYLFVQTTNEEAGKNQRSVIKTPSSPELEQDPSLTATTTLLKPVGIPQCAISVSRAFRASTTSGLADNNDVAPSASKKPKPSVSGGKLSLMEAAMSDEEEMEDVMFLFDEDKDEELVGKGNGKKVPLLTSKPIIAPSIQTDFVPDSLDQSTLPLLSPPSYATPSATMRLNRELKTILKIQENTPLHELGWYINAELVSNVYQWIVELHSFESILPLAKDMKAAGVTSVVLEIRFGKDYPHSPPFVRVIRPRFLPFLNGGGGHVTGGGAMCMELLTNTGWSAVSSIESVLLQVRMAIMNLEPKPARLENRDKGQQHDYGTAEAMEAYIRACRAHHWEIPKDFQDFAAGAGPSY